MGHPNLQQRERVADLGEGLSIWKVHIDCVREQEINARVMQPRKFDQLTRNIQKRQNLESLPYTYNLEPADPTTEFLLISGHHRVRAARSAGLQEIFILNDEKEMTRSEIVAKQLAHNALNGMDDPQTLSLLYNEIADMESRIETGLTDQEVKAMASEIRVDDLSLDIDYEILNIVFVQRDYKRFSEVMDLLDKEATIYVADKKEFDKFVEQTKNVTTAFNIRNMAAIVAKMTDLLQEYFGVAPAGGNPDWFAANVGRRRGMIPPPIMQKFDEAMASAEKITGSNKFAPNFEAILADFLSGSPAE